MIPYFFGTERGKEFFLTTNQKPCRGGLYLQTDRAFCITMAKELPYFKFEPSQWENGNIQMCSDQSKALFIELCCIYWSRLGDLPYALALHKHCKGDDSAIIELISAPVIQVVNDHIIIEFLDEQLSEFQEISKKRSKAAKTGAVRNSNFIKEAHEKGNKIYCIYCHDEEESFYKIGITSSSVVRRFNGRLPYEWELIYQFHSEDYLDLEIDFKELFLDSMYIPKHKFDGSRECIDSSNQTEIYAFFDGLGAVQIQSTSKAQTIIEEDIRLEKKKEEERKRIESDLELSPTFLEVWELYEKKKGPLEKLKKKWLSLSQKDREKIMLYIPEYKIEQPDPKFRKNFQTFLNNKSWNDEIIKPIRKKSRTEEFIASEGGRTSKFFAQD